MWQLGGRGRLPWAMPGRGDHHPTAGVEPMHPLAEGHETTLRRLGGELGAGKALAAAGVCHAQA